MGKEVHANIAKMTTTAPKLSLNLQTIAWQLPKSCPSIFTKRKVKKKWKKKDKSAWQPGCLVSKNKLYFNVHKGKESYSKSRASICCNVIPEPACGASASLEQMERGSCLSGKNNDDNSLSHIQSEGDCLTAAKELGYKGRVGLQRKSTWPKGCLQSNGKLYFNKHTNGKESYSPKKVSICCRGAPRTVCGKGASPIQMGQGSCLTAKNDRNGISLSHIGSSDLCLAAAKELSFDFYATDFEEKLSTQDKSTWPTGCVVSNDKLYWNTHSGKESYTASRANICCIPDMNLI